jgi:hypothetical protein
MDSARQARVFLECLAENENQLSVADLMANSATGLRTVQGPWAVFVHYRKRLIDERYVTISNEPVFEP